MDSVTRFFASGFFHESPSPKPLKITVGSFRIFSKIRGDIRKSKCTTNVNDTSGKFATGVNDIGGKKLPPVSTTPAANLPPVSSTPAANFATSSACVSTTPVANCHRCRWHQWQIMGTISGCRHLKVNLKAKFFIYVNSSTQRCPNKIMKIFLIEFFPFLPF